MRKLIFILCMPLICASVDAQEQELQTVYATGGSGALVNWPQLKKEADADKDGPGFFYGDCDQGVGSPAASSYLAAQGSKNYLPSNLNDSDPMTAWVEGKPGYGIGEWFKVTSPKVNTIYNGYQATPIAWKNNSRVKKFKVYMDNEPLCLLVLEDKMDGQRFELPLEEADWDKPHEFKFVIVEVYKGLKYDDVAISHVDLSGCCVAEGTLVDSGNSPIPIDEIAEGSTVTVVDPAAATVTTARVTKVASVLHVDLLEVTTDSHSLLLTADHQLFVRDMGFCSLSSAKRKMKVSGYNELKGIEVMIWNERDQMLAFTKILTVRQVRGPVKTYVIRGLERGTSYLVNGFVTKTY